MTVPYILSFQTTYSGLEHGHGAIVALPRTLTDPLDSHLVRGRRHLKVANGTKA
jgi:hypothetical protein